MSPPPLLRLSALGKRFGGVRALEEAHLTLEAGTVTALIGENGAGKSTLVKILTGVYAPDQGEIEFDGRRVRIASPSAAEALGISVIHQESVVFEDLSIAENVFVTHPPRRHGLIDWVDMRRRAGALLRQLESGLDPRALLRGLSVAERHVVQIARALSHEARLVIMDEPTAALSQHEADDLLRIVARLRGEGRAVLYISHKFEEIFSAADRYVVLRDGSTVGAGRITDTNLDELVRLMAGRAVAQLYPERRSAPARSAAPGGALPGGAPMGEEILRVHQLCCADEFEGVSFALRRGEILGIYGLVGAGRSELMQVLFGLRRPRSGRIELHGQPLELRNPGDAIRSGIAFVPEDRQNQGAVLGRSIRDNVALPSLARLGLGGWASTARETALAAEWIAQLQVRCQGPAQALQELSGGNQQKVVLGKWLATAPKLLILDEPTKGIDIGAKMAVHRLMRELATQGLAVIMVSSELPEVLGMSDRILVMRRGRVAAQFDAGSTSAEQVLHAATVA